MENQYPLDHPSKLERSINDRPISKWNDSKKVLMALVGRDIAVCLRVQLNLYSTI